MKMPPEKFFIPVDTEVLTPQGFMNYETLARNTDIYACHNGRLILNRCLGVEVGEYAGEMYCFAGKNVEMLTSLKSKMLCLVGRNFTEIEAGDLFQGSGGMCGIPYAPKNIENDYSITPATLKKWGKARKIPDDPFVFSRDQLSVLVKAWPNATKSRLVIMDNNETDRLQHILMLAGCGSTRENGFIRILDDASDRITSHERIIYEGLVWRPIIRSSAAIYRRNGTVFTGSCC